MFRRDFDKSKFLKNILSWVVSILIVIIMAYSIVNFGVQTVRISGQAMNPTLESGDTVFVNKLVYDFSAPKRYDIIAFKLRNNTNSYYNIKRIVGLPGETIQIKDGYIFINGNKLDDVPFDELIVTEGLAAEEIVLGEEEFFVIGDNCNNSEDSRFANIGTIEENEILGRISYRIMPFSEKGNIN